MADKVLDLVNGSAKEVAVWNCKEGEDNQVTGAVEMEITDDDELQITFGGVWIILPTERLIALLGGRAAKQNG